MNGHFINFILDYIYFQSLADADRTAKFMTEDKVKNCNDRRNRAKQWKASKESSNGTRKSNEEFACDLFRTVPMLTLVSSIAV